MLNQLGLGITILKQHFNRYRFDKFPSETTVIASIRQKGRQGKKPVGGSGSQP